jgi:hypothetical protein
MHDQTAAVMTALDATCAQLGRTGFIHATDPLRHWAGVAVRRVSLIAVSLVLMLFAAYSSSVVSIGGRIISDIALVKDTDFYGKAHDLMKLSSAKDDPAKIDEGMHALRQAASTYQSVVLSHQRLTEMGSLMIRPLVKIAKDNNENYDFLSKQTMDRPAGASHYPQPISTAGLPFMGAVDPAALNEYVEKNPDKAIKAGTFNEVSAYLISNNVDVSPTFLSQLKIIERDTLSYMDIFGGWLLPIICGLLGGLVYVMRMLLEPDNTFNLNDIAIRVLAGGVAGLVVGWFLAPTALNTGSIAPVTATPFGLAFFAGFSIDVLFVILDRIKRAMVEPVPPPNPPKA